MLLGFVWRFFLITATILQYFNDNVLCVNIIVVTATVYIELLTFSAGDFCGYSNCRFCAMILCFVWSLCGLRQQLILKNVSLLFLVFIGDKQQNL